MKLGALARSLTDTSVLELAKRIQRKRKIIAGDPFMAATVPTHSAQGWLRKLGFERIDISASPELTLAKILREWRVSERRGSLGVRVNYIDPEEARRHYLDRLRATIGEMEFRVFDLDPTDTYPRFESLTDWLMWRLPIAHPQYRCSDTDLGWSRELYVFAIEESKLAFD